MKLSVCIEVLWPSQPIRVMSSTVSLPNHMFSWVVLVLQAINQYLCTFFPQKLTTALLESVEERMTIENISRSISTVECCRTQQGSNRDLITSRTHIRLSHRGRQDEAKKWAKCFIPSNLSRVNKCYVTTLCNVPWLIY